MPPPSLAAATALRGRRVAPGERHGRLSVSRSSQRAVYFTLWAPAGRVRKAERKCGRATEVLGEKTRESEAAGDAPGTQRNRQSFHTAQVGSGGRSPAAKLDRWSVTHAELAGKDCSLPAVPGLQLLQEAPHQIQVATHAATRLRGLCTPRSDPREFRQLRGGASVPAANEGR